MSYKERLELFNKLVEGPKLDFKKIRDVSFGGIPDEVRSLYWKILLSYLPDDKSSWNEVLLAKRKSYHEFIEVLMIDPRKNEPVNDHPLSTATNSQWNAFFKDKELLEEVDKDVKRTLPHLHFFNHDKLSGDTLHYEALKRILFIYAKLNPGIRYVQGMNEILGPIYYLFANDSNPLFKGHAEPDSFFCFTNLMSEIRDNFMKTLDKDATYGIQGRIKQLNNLLLLKDPEVWQDLEDKKLNPQFYSFRWLTLLLSQEFDLPDVIRLWDSLFSDPFRFEFLLYICCAMIVSLRIELLEGTFADNLKLLQNYPSQDVLIIINKAIELKDENYTIPPSYKTTTSQNTGGSGYSLLEIQTYSNMFGTKTRSKSLSFRAIPPKPVTPISNSPTLVDEEVWPGPLTSNKALPHVPKPFDELEDDHHHSSSQSVSHQLPTPSSSSSSQPQYKSHPLE